ncbi:MAG: hypothetical protein I3J00_10890 [Mesosutterella multiformis]|nr:hypothetical protein [Mesosutterella multiformis]
MLFLVYPTPETERPSYFGLMNRGRGWVHAFADIGTLPRNNGLAKVVLEWLQALEHDYEADFSHPDELLCPVCGASGDHLVLRASDFDHDGHPTEWNILYCKDCGNVVRRNLTCQCCGRTSLFGNALKSDYYRRREGKLVCPECGETVE